jgi:glutathione S-transferase
LITTDAPPSSTRLTLVLGDRNRSSWSLRAWLALRQAGLTFEEVVIGLGRPDSAERIATWSPSGRLPVLLVDKRPIWDSLAICELAAESKPELWPEDWLARAHARAISAEMHSGFAELRSFMPMELTSRFDAPGRMLSSVARDISRIEAIWSDCRRRYGGDGPYLFGRFSIADAMYAPVVSRFLTYAVELGPQATAYLEDIQRLPAWREWAAAAAAEVEAHSADEAAPARSAERERAGPAPALSLAETNDDVRQPALAATGSPAADRDPGQRQLRGVDVKPIGGGIHRRR